MMCRNHRRSSIEGWGGVFMEITQPMADDDDENDNENDNDNDNRRVGPRCLWKSPNLARPSLLEITTVSVLTDHIFWGIGRDDDDEDIDNEDTLRILSASLWLTMTMTMTMTGGPNDNDNEDEDTLRILSASLWLTPLVLLPLMDKTRSPFWIRPSRSARLPAITLCT